MPIAPSHRLLGLGIAAGFLLGASAAVSPAQTPERPKPDAAWSDLARRAQVVVIGKVIQVDSRWEGKKIVSIARVQPLEVLKDRVPGGVPKVLEVRVLGGQVGPWAQEFSHETPLLAGETAVLFLAARPAAQPLKGSVFSLLGEEAKVSLLRPRDPDSRLMNNRRLAASLRTLRAAIQAGL